MTTFADLGLPRPIVQVLERQGITEPFPIQEAAIPDALAGRDVLGRGPTGSGKTFTFGLPMLSRLAKSGASRPGHPRGLVLVPTRELASQVRERLDDPAASLGLRVLDVVGGVNINNQIRSLAAPVDLLVATPGRAQDLVNQKKLFFDNVQFVALDEADQMADMGFLPQVRKLLNLTPKGGQRLLFSATLDGEVQKLVDAYMRDPVTHSTAPAQASVDTMTHYRLLVGDRETKNDIILRIAAREGKTILFMRTKHGVDRQVKKLRRVGIEAQGLHGDKSQGARTRAITGFQDGSIPVLVATDIAARGIDISDVSLVVHVDPPAEHKAYLHRAGRTARAGTEGTVVTLVMDEQRREVTQLLKKAGVDAEEVRVGPDSSELAEITGARVQEGAPLPPPGQPAQGKAGGRRQAGGRRGADAGGRGQRDGGRASRSGGTDKAEGRRRGAGEDRRTSDSSSRNNERQGRRRTRRSW
ncbi:DEAD/DEAH box helicase [Corynebacterium guangdongense]|uniref:Superfamily II DNA/RNA helicase n=1 Tax=Corynebacterium guangdongense TaxID=1783348 RepID=A0ABU1ZY39_9CORY|nr:DEAD/DEAH box helicase [Corynebacterium guangdongense]MDR7329308.1 superfamily II DNA/RNA helicase [Corynebacterium guangdongense]WJZ17874.1 ATP-dependent RNA helicase RhlE [Corynebacterium guangdongense]